ncbi:hypothetical protein MBLNU459_g2896t1 [Dothideomycetes sp. NU459]
MYQTSYSVPPPYYTTYDYRTPPVSPAPHGYYSPRYSVYTSTPSPRPSAKVHARRATQDYTRSSPRVTSYYAEAEYSAPKYTTQPRKSDYVSGSDRYQSQPQRGWSTREGSGGKTRRYTTSRTYCVYRDDGSTDEEEYLPAYERCYETRKTPPPPYSQQQRYREPEADHYPYCDQVPIYTKAEEPKTRPRRASYTTKTYTSPPKPRPSTAKPPPPKATDADARRAGIPAGYSFKNWDPSEEPILLLGSVFDANSLGKWIYDWTVAFHGPATPMSEIAGDLWLLLIQLAGKIKRAEETMPRVRRTDDRETIEDFLDSGERLWQRFNELLKVCERFMLKAARKESGGGKNLQMGKKSGCEFVDAIFGRDRELERTEKLMTGIRLWSMRFDANCEEILRHP